VGLRRERDRYYDIVAKIQAGDTEAAIAAISSLDQLDTLTSDVFKKIGAIKPSTLGGHLLMMASFQAALRSWGFKVFAKDQVNQTKELIGMLAQRSAAELGARGRRGGRRAPRADGAADRADRRVGRDGRRGARLHDGEERQLHVLDPEHQALSTSFQSAGAAGVNYFETLLVEPARSSSDDDDQARVRIAMSEPNYLVSYMLSHLQQVEGLPKQLKEQWGEKSPQWNLMMLAAASSPTTTRPS